MGTAPSNANHTIRNAMIRLAIRALCFASPSLNAFFTRLQQTPGLPLPNPSTPYWTLPPALIAQHGSDPAVVIPAYADIVIIGSGITGTAVARTVLDYDAKHGLLEHDPLQVVMLEARDTCSGATARNGGHITPPLYHDYSELKKEHGMEVAKQIIRFRLSHVEALLEVATEENLLEESQCREVQTFDVFQNKDLYEDAKKRIEEYRADLPVEGAQYQHITGEENLRHLQLSNKTLACITTQAGAIHPYRLVTGILSRLLQSYPSNFHLFTHTPCTDISIEDPSNTDFTFRRTKSADGRQLYTVHTTKGTIHTPHVVHATNAWVSHLLPQMRGRVIPAKEIMTAQIPRQGLGDSPEDVMPSPEDGEGNGEGWSGKRSFVLHYLTDKGAKTFDYLTQQPADGRNASQPFTDSGDEKNGKKATFPSPQGELMLGSGLLTHWKALIGNVDDGQWNQDVAKRLEGEVGEWFDVGDAVGHLTGGNSAISNASWLIDFDTGRDERGEKEKLKAVWSGLLGISADSKPWVGRVPTKIADRAPYQRLTKGVHGVLVRAKTTGGHEVKFNNGQEAMEMLSDSDAKLLEKAMNRKIELASPGEWISAGYSGEGMVHAWMSAKALGYMVLGLDRNPGLNKDLLGPLTEAPLMKNEGERKGEGVDTWFPDVYRVTEERWGYGGVEELVARMLFAD